MYLSSSLPRYLRIKAPVFNGFSRQMQVLLQGQPTQNEPANSITLQAVSLSGLTNGLGNVLGGGITQLASNNNTTNNKQQHLLQVRVL